MIRLPKHRPPTHPGEVLLRDCIEPVDMTVTEAAKRLGISRVRLSELVNGRRAVTPNTALRLARLFGTEPDFWLNLQLRWDLWHEMHSSEAAAIERIRPLDDVA